MGDTTTIGWLGLSPLESSVWQSIVVDRSVADVCPECDVVVVNPTSFPDREELDEFCRDVDVPCLLFVPDEDIPTLANLASSWLDLIPDSAGIEYFEHRLYRFAESILNHRDALTGVLDRRSGILKVRKMFEQSDCLSATFVDLDRFKDLNDKYGHAAGDEVLRKVGSLLNSARNAIVSRFGGEEFLIVRACDETEAVEHAERTRGFLSEVEFDSGARITGSFGVADNAGGLSLREVLRNAEEALYAAKGNGRDRTVRYSELERKALQSGEDVAISGLETRTRVLTDRMANYVTLMSNRLLKRARKEAETDGLTGVYNRRYLDRRLEGELADSRRQMAVALFDLDHFGQVNKQHGWPSGDKVLKEAVETARGVLREGDWIGRYGGEEFCVVLPDTGVEDASEVMERLRIAFEQRSFESTNGAPLTITASVGVVERNGSGESAHELLERVSQLALKPAYRDWLSA